MEIYNKDYQSVPANNTSYLAKQHFIEAAKFYS